MIWGCDHVFRYAAVGLDSHNTLHTFPHSVLFALLFVLFFVFHSSYPWPNVFVFDGICLVSWHHAKLRQMFTLPGSGSAGGGECFLHTPISHRGQVMKPKGKFDKILLFLWVNLNELNWMDKPFCNFWRVIWSQIIATLVDIGRSFPEDEFKKKRAKRLNGWVTPTLPWVLQSRDFSS